jgi:hypothetical protein
MGEDIFKEHEMLFSADTALKLGKAHYIILKADTTLDDRTTIRLDAKAPFSQTKLTPLGCEIGGNFVKWFLRKHIESVGILKTKFETILPTLIELKHLADNTISESKATSYEEFLRELLGFIQTRKVEVNNFYEFLVWLNQMDELAPNLLFSHPIWSYSELSSHSFTIRKEEDERALHLCIELVFGLCKMNHPIGPIPILASEYSDTASDWSSSVDPEEWGNRPCPITYETVFPRASKRILKEFATYFEKIRDSAESVIEEISYLNKGELLTNDTFLNLFLTKALPPHVQENKLWDFKETYGAWHNSKLEELKVILAADIAAFANNRGGLLLVGFSNKREIIGLNEIEAKILQTQEILKSYFTSDSESISLYPLKLLCKNGKQCNCLIIIIPQTKNVIDVKKTLGGKEFLCPIRISSGTSYTNHTEVEKTKVGFIDNNRYFAKDLADFVYFGTGVT